jgi:hypothetical protein
MSLSEFEELYRDIEEKKERATGLFKIALKEALDNVLKIGISKIKWRQYTPYFNDGEACVFNVHEPVFYIDNGIVPKYFSLEEDEEDGGWYYASSYRAKEDGDNFSKEIEKLNRMFTDLDSYYFLNSFDDHSEITYDGKEFEINDYSHD